MGDVKVVELEGEAYENFHKNTPQFPNGFVRLEPYNQVVPRCFLKDLEKIRDFQITDEDIWVSTFPKCGTTWTQEMVWCIMHDLDFAKAKSVKLRDRVKFFEETSIVENEEIAKFYGSVMDKIRDQTEVPRIIKTHLSWQMLPHQIKTNTKAKIIYVSRNPRDACVSFYNHWKVLEGYEGTFEEFANAFLNDVAGYYSPIIHHAIEYWNERERENVCFVTFEDMKNDLPAVLRKVSKFLEKPLNEEQIKILAEHLSFDKMKTNKAVNKEETLEACREKGVAKTDKDAKFMRKGQVGDWRNHFTPQLEERFKAWEEKSLIGSDLKFTFDL